MKKTRRATTVLLLFGLLVVPWAFAQQKARQLQKAAKPRAEQADPLRQLLRQAEEATEKKDYAAAIAALQQYVAQRPADAYAHFQLGYALTALERWEEAKAQYRKAIELDPKMAAAHLNLGLLLIEREPAAAVEPFTTVSELQPDQARPRFLLGWALERSGKGEAAVDHYKAAIRLAPKTFDIHFALARTLLSLNRPTEAEAEFREALALDAEAPAARLGLGESLIAQRKFEPAAKELGAYLQAQPHDRETRIQLASLYVDLGRDDDALAELDRAEAGAPASLAASRLRAEIHVRQRRFDEAATAFQKAVDLAPRDAELRARLGRVWLEKRDFPAAERELLEALRLNADLIEPLRDLVAAYYLGEKYQAALRALDKLAQREAPTAGSWFVRATCYDKLGMKPEALAAYEKFLALDQGRSENQDFQARQRVRILTRELKKQ